MLEGILFLSSSDERKLDTEFPIIYLIPEGALGELSVAVFNQDQVLTKRIGGTSRTQFRIGDSGDDPWSTLLDMENKAIVFCIGTVLRVR